MPTFDYSEFERKIRNRKKAIGIKIFDILDKAGEEIYDDIETGAVEPFSPSWKAAQKGDGTGRYFSPIGNGGLFDAIKEARGESIDLRVSNDLKKMSLRIGNKNALDAATIAQKGYPYWRLFELGAIGARAGGSADFGYVPFQGGGYSDKVSPYGRANRPNPGVLPVFVFGDTFRYFKPAIEARITQAVKDICNGKYDEQIPL